MASLVEQHVNVISPTPHIAFSSSSPIQTKIPDLMRVGVHPLVHLSSCRPRTVSVNSTLSVSHLFISLPQLADQEGSAIWRVDVPGYMSGETCIEVFIEGSSIGASVHIPPIRCVCAFLMG